MRALVLIFSTFPATKQNKSNYSKTCLKRPLSKKQKLVFKTNYHLMQVKSIEEYSAMLSARIKQTFVIKIFVLSILSGCLRPVLLYQLQCNVFIVPAYMFLENKNTDKQHLRDCSFKYPEDAREIAILYF